MKGLARKKNFKIRKQRRPVRSALRKVMPIVVGIFMSVSFLGYSSSKNKAANRKILNSNQRKSIMAEDKTKKAIPVKLTKSERRLRDILIRLGAKKEELGHYRESELTAGVQLERGKPWGFNALLKLAESCEKLGLSYDDFFQFTLIATDPWRGERKFLIKQRDPLKLRRGLEQLRTIVQHIANETNLDVKYLEKRDKMGPTFNLVSLKSMSVIKTKSHLELCVEISFLPRAREIPKKLVR